MLKQLLLFISRLKTGSFQMYKNELMSYVCKRIKKVKLPTNYERLKNISSVFELIQFYINGSYN